MRCMSQHDAFRATVSHSLPNELFLPSFSWNKKKKLHTQAYKGRTKRKTTVEIKSSCMYSWLERFPLHNYTHSSHWIRHGSGPINGIRLIHTTTTPTRTIKKNHRMRCRCSTTHICRYIFLQIQAHLCESCASPQLHCYQASRTAFTNTHTQININRSYQFSVYIHLASTHSCEALVLSPFIYECMALQSMLESGWLEPEWIFSLSYILHIQAYFHTPFIPSFRSNSCWYACTLSISLSLARFFYLTSSITPTSFILSPVLSIHVQFSLSLHIVKTLIRLAESIHHPTNTAHFAVFPISTPIVHSHWLGTVEPTVKRSKTFCVGSPMYCYMLCAP